MVSSFPLLIAVLKCSPTNIECDGIQFCLVMKVLSLVIKFIYYEVKSCTMDQIGIVPWVTPLMIIFVVFRCPEAKKE